MGHVRLLGCSKTGSPRLRRILAGLCCGLALAWSSIASGALWATHGPGGGQVNTIAVDPSTPSTLYAGTDGGGFFKSLDGGETWTPSSEGVDLGTLLVRITGIAVDPATPSRLYASATVGLDGGVFRSTDAGASWSFTQLGPQFAIAVDPITPSIVYAVGVGIQKSVDAGANWTEVRTGGNFSCVAIDRTSPGTVYAGDFFGGMYKTTDGGATWKFVFGHPTEPFLAVAIHPTMSNIVYAGAEDAGVYKTVDDGKTWNPIGPNVADGQQLVVRGLAIDPKNPDTVYAAGLTINGGFSVYKTTNGGSTWTSTPITVVTETVALDPVTPTNVFVGALDDGFWKSTDGAVTWAEKNAGLANTRVEALAVDATPGTVYAATARNGVHRSTDGGATWQHAAFVSFDQLLSLATDPTAPGTVYLGTVFSGVIKSIDGGDSWSRTPGGPVFVKSIVVDPSTPSTVYAAGLGGAFVSTVGGASWSPINTGLPQIVFSLAIDPTAPSTLYAGSVSGATVGIFKTTNAGGMWTPINTGLEVPDSLAVTALAVDPVSPNTVYAAFENAGVFKTTDGGAHWAAANDGLLSLRVLALAIDPRSHDILFAATADQGVFVSGDGGANWAPMNDGLFDRVVLALAADSDRLYAGTVGDGAFAMLLSSVTTTTTSTTTSTTLPPAILGKTLEIKDPTPADPSRRQVVVTAKELASSDPLDPATVAANGATLTIITVGATPSRQSFFMPPPWKLLGTTGARYVDNRGVNGPVKLVQLSKTTKGTFEVKVKLQAKVGAGPQPRVQIVPPNPGFGASILLHVNGGTKYCIAFGGAAGGVIADKGATSFKVTKPTAEACFPEDVP